MERVERKSISEQVFDQLKEQIINGEWEPGSKIPSENELTQILGVSRITVREALQKMVTLGLLEVRQGEGTFLRKMSADTYMNSLLPFFLLDRPETISILEYRKIVEIGVAELAVERATKKDIKKLEEIIQEMKENMDDVKKYTKEDLKFHLTLAEITGNPVIIKVIYLTMDVIKKSMRDLYSPLDIRNFGLHYHEEILNAIKSRNKEQARKLMGDHIKAKIKSLEK